MPLFQKSGARIREQSFRRFECVGKRATEPVWRIGPKKSRSEVGPNPASAFNFYCTFNLFRSYIRCEDRMCRFKLNFRLTLNANALDRRHQPIVNEILEVGL